MITCFVRRYLDSETRLVLLEKYIDFHAMPRVGEFVKFINAEMGDYFAFRIDEVTHREGHEPALGLDRLPPRDGRQAAFNEDDLDEYTDSYLAEGWLQRSTVSNHCYTHNEPSNSK
jgi:hypothetical protein